jgi:flagellar protein FlaG
MASELNPVLTQVPGEASVQSDSARPNQVQREQIPGADAKINLPFQDGEKGKKELTEEDVKKISEFLNSSSSVFNLSIRFKVAEESDKIVISVFDKETDELIRQIPSQEILDLASRLNEMVGVLFNETA